MKKVIILLSGLFLLLSIASCSKQLLDKTPLDLITSDVVWKDKILTDAILTGAYSQMYVWEHDNIAHITSSSLHFTLFAINAVSDETRSNAGWAFDAGYFKNGGLRIGGGLLEWWDASYFVIRTLNNFIVQVSQGSLDETFKKERIAEARYLRAYAYFAMVERYGGVPLITTAQAIDAPKDSLYPQRATEQAIYDFVISECDAIIVDLPATHPASDYGRGSKYAALALKSRAALYAASIAQFGTLQLNGLIGIESSKANYYYQQSYNAAEQIINSGQFALYNKYPNDKVKNFRQLFLDKMPGNSEVIFSRPHNNQSPDQGGNGWTYDFFQSPMPNGWGSGNQDGPYLETAEAFEYVDGSSGALDHSAIQQGVWTTEELWANKDPRFFASIYTMNTEWKGRKLDNHNGIVLPDGKFTNESYNNIQGQGPSFMSMGFGVLKYLDEGFNNQGNNTISSQDYIVFRYGEVLLNFAEAAFNLGKADEALEVVNQIRARGGIALRTSVDREDIRQERKVELMFEGHRYWDLRRWRIATEVLSVNRSALQYIHDFNTGKLKLHIIRNADGTVSVPQFYPHNYYLPVTLQRTGVNPNLVENPGYQ